MFTFGAVPKACTGHIGIIQRNAVESWKRLPGSPRVVLFGNEAGVERLARDCGVEHVPTVATNTHGTPLLSGVLSHVRTLAGTDLCCFLNADIVLLPDWMHAVEQVQQHCNRFLAVGECWNIDVPDAMTWSADTEKELRDLARQRGVRRGKRAIDYFCFTPDVFVSCPPLAVGRAYVDNWLLWQALRQGAMLVDLSKETCVLHQNHDYSHLGGGFHATRFGAEARENLRAAGGIGHLSTLHDCTHVLRGGVPQRSWTGTLHLMRPFVLFAAGVRTLWHMFGLSRFV